MKKTLLTICISFFALTSYAQDPDIVGTWYIHELLADLSPPSSILNIQPTIAPFIVIDNAYNFTGFIACNEYSGSLIFDQNEQAFSAPNTEKTLTNCESSTHNSFEDYYIEILKGTSSPYLLYTTGPETLFLEDFLGFGFIYKNTPLAINDKKLNRFLIYPNPATKTITISSKTLSPELITVYSMTGQVEVKFSNKSQIDISKLQNGVYFIEIIAEGHRSFERFIKK